MFASQTSNILLFQKKLRNKDKKSNQFWQGFLQEVKNGTTHNEKLHKIKLLGKWILRLR